MTFIIGTFIGILENILMLPRTLEVYDMYSMLMEHVFPQCVFLKAALCGCVWVLVGKHVKYLRSLWEDSTGDVQAPASACSLFECRCGVPVVGF